MKRVNLDGVEKLKIFNARISKKNKLYIDNLYKLLHRKGHLKRDCQKL